MVGVLVRVEYAVEPIDLGIKQLLAQIGRCIDENAGNAARAAPLDQERGAAPAVLRIVRIARAPAQRRTRHAARGSAAQNCEFQRHAAAAAGRGTLANNRKKFSVVCRAISSNDTPRASASTLAVSLTQAGSLRLPRWRLGARYGASVSTRIRSGGSPAAMVRSAPEFLNVRIPVKEMKWPSAMARRARSAPPVKQCSTAGKGPLPVSSSRMRAMSASASREWITSGSPVSRAAAIWA